MKWSEKLPVSPGRYVVQTKSPVLKTIRTIDAHLYFPQPGKHKWSFSNQIFYRYLAI